MDPLSALALASAVIQFVDFSWKVAKRLDEYSSANPAETPRSLQAVCTQLPLLLNALGRMKADEEVGTVDLNTRCILRGVVAGCRQQVEELDAIIDEVARAPGDSLRVRLRKVFVSLKKDERVWAIERNLQTYVSVLILHHVVDTSAASPAIAEAAFFYDVREQAVASFVERPKLSEKLDASLAGASKSLAQTPVLTYLTGEKGAGKTQLALAYTHAAHQGSRFQTIFWRDASSSENLCLGLESIAAVIRRSTHGSRQEKLDFVQNFFGDLWHPWLLVLDNYDPSTTEGLPSFLPYRGSGAIILISEIAPTQGNVVHVPTFLTPEAQNQLDSSLAAAVQRKDVAGIKDLLAQGANVDTMIWNEWPVLHRAALFGLDEIVQTLLAQGASADPPIALAKPLYWAAADGHLTIVSRLLNHEDMTGNFYKPKDYDEALGAAADGGYFDIAKTLLVRRDVRLDCEVHYGQTALQLAAKNGHAKVVDLLLEYGALRQQPTQAVSAFVSAASGGHLETLKILCEKGGTDVNSQSEDGRTALYYAAYLKDKASKATGEEMVEYLLNAGADPNLCSRDGGPIHQAAVYDHIEIIDRLLAHSADPAHEPNGWSPLSIAIKYKSQNAAKRLLKEAPSDPEKRESFCLPALCNGDRSLCLLQIELR